MTMYFLQFAGKLDNMRNHEYAIANTILPNAEKGVLRRKEIPVAFGSHGIRLYGKIMLPEHANINNPVPGAVLCHGFGADQNVMESSALLLVKKGVATIIFDMRGHGLSEGYLDDKSYEDVIDAWRILTSLPEIDSSHVALIGHSLGAMSSILATRKIKKPKVIVALSCPSEIDGALFRDPSHKAHSLARWLITCVWKLTVWFSRLKVRVDWKKFLESWPKIKLTPILAELDECAKLFVFSASDRLASYKRFFPFYEKAPGPKKIMLTRGSHVTPIEAEILRFEWVGWAVSALTLSN
jgi:pimeloyl-ACP methyl ester carboxylesterase